jgi:phosphorylcholine metabolism protein LicD
VRIIRIQTRRLVFVKDISLMDIFVKRLVDDRYYWTVGVKKAVMKSAPRRFYEQTTRMEFDGASYSVPRDYEGYLEYHYGRDWRTPVKEWNFRTSDSCERKILY